jgi:hypothetical protein
MGTAEHMFGHRWAAGRGNGGAGWSGRGTIQAVHRSNIFRRATTIKRPDCGKCFDDRENQSLISLSASRLRVVLSL